MKTRSSSRGRGESCSLKSTNESRGCASDISQSAQHDNTNSNRSFLELTKNSRKRRHSDVTCSSKKAATNYQEESEHDQLANVLNKTVSVVLEPFDVEKRIQAKVANRNKKKCVSNYSVRDVKITTKSSNGCSTENQESSTTGSMDSRSSERCLQKSTHHDGKELHNSDQKNVASLSLSHDDDQGLLESSTHQSRRQLWDASHKMSSEFRRERRKIYKKPVCTCCVGKDNNSGNEIRVASDGLKAKHNKHMEKSIRNSDVNRSASRTQKRKTVVGASHSKVKDADYQYGGRPLTTEHSSTSSETITTLKMTSEVFKDGQSSRNREIINSHSSRRSVTPTSCSVATAPLQMRDSAASQPAHALTHSEMHPNLRRRSASAPPQLQLGDTFRKTVDLFARLLQDVAAHLQKCANRVGGTLSDHNFEHMVAGVSHLVSSCTCHSPIGCLLYSINIMNALKSRLSAELNVVSLSNGDAVQPAAAGTQSNGNLMGRFHLEASIKEKTNTEASVEGGSISESAPQCDATTLTTKSRHILSPAETCISTSHSTSLTEETNDTPSPVGSTDNAHIEASIRETAQLEANTKESTSTITCITEDNVSKSASEYGATSSSVEPIIMVSAAGTFVSTSSSPTGGAKEILDLHEVDTVVSDQNNVNDGVDDRTGCSSSKSNLMCGSAEREQDGEQNTFDSVCLSMEEIEIKEEVETSESDSESELSEKQYSQNGTESDAAGFGPEGDETDRYENMVEVECNIDEVSDLINHTGSVSHKEDLGLEAQYEHYNDSTGNVIAEDAASNAASIGPVVDCRDDTHGVNNTACNGNQDIDGDMGYGGNRNEDGVGDNTAESTQDHSNEDNGDAGATKEGDNRNGENVGDAKKNTGARSNGYAWLFEGQHSGPGFAGPDYRLYRDPDIIHVQALICTVRLIRYRGHEETNVVYDAHEELWLECAQKLATVIQQIIEFAKMVPGFMKLSQDDQIVLLKAGSFELAVLRMSRYYDLSQNSVLYSDTMLPQDAFYTNETAEMKLVTCVFEFAKSVAELKLTETELALYSACILLSTDRPGLKGLAEISRLSQAVLRALRLELDRNHAVPIKGDVTVCDAMLAKIATLRELSMLHMDALAKFKRSTPHLEFPALHKELFSVDS